MQNQIKSLGKIVIQCDGSIHFFEAQDIILLKAANNYTEIILTKNRKMTISKTLKHFETYFDKYNFFRIHNSYLINLDHIKRYNKLDGGTIIMTNNQEVSISRTKKDSFLNLIGYCV